MTSKSDPKYPHGKLSPKQLNGVAGFLLGLQYNNPASLGKALRRLKGVFYWTATENDRVVIWLDSDATRQLPHQLAERITWLAQFEVKETKQPCDKCRRQEVLYTGGKYGYQVRLVCFKCSRLASANSDKALAAREEAEKLSNVLPIFRPLRKVKKAA